MAAVGRKKLTLASALRRWARDLEAEFQLLMLETIALLLQLMPELFDAHAVALVGTKSLGRGAREALLEFGGVACEFGALGFHLGKQFLVLATESALFLGKAG